MKILSGTRYRCVTLTVLWAATFACSTPSDDSSVSTGDPVETLTVDWRTNGVCYEIFVRSFFDSDGDGIGDLNGLTQKLDYINDGNPDSLNDLGAQCVWLMPVAESPSYHGYDVTDYYRVERDYGTNEDFKRLVDEAHSRGIRVLVDLVLNHASAEHPFFREASVDPDSPYRDWFIWSPTNPGWQAPWGSDSWHRSPVRDEYYYGIFWSGMPDLNNANPEVREEAKKVATFWLQDMGVDGFRLDAVPYLIEEGDQVMHTAGTHDFLRDFAAHVRATAPDAYTIGEVWFDLDVMLTYYPDQLDSHFGFDVADAIIEAVRTESAEDLLQPALRLQQAIPNDRWSPFLRNHDQTRALTAIEGDVANAKLAATLLFTMPGLSFVYYGEEIGMVGDKPDPRLRTPMQWNAANGAGFTTGTVWEPLQENWQTVNVEAQESDPGSLLNLYRRLIHLRAEHPALGAGQLVPLSAGREDVAAYVRRGGDRTVLVVANLGGAQLSGVTLRSVDGALPAGRYDANGLLDGPDGSELEVGEAGRIEGYVPLPSLGPWESYLFDLTRSDG